MTDKPLVTIVIQTYNRRQMLEDAIKSAQAQTYNNIEILIGDNNSEDGTEDFCLKQVKLDPRIKYFRHPVNIGMVGNANFLLDRVKGEYFVFLNDDDWLDLDYVEKSIKFLHGRDDYSMVCPSTLLYKNNYSKKYIKKCKVAKLNSSSVFKRIKEYVSNQDDIEMSTGCFRTSILKNIKTAEGQYIIDRYNEDIILEMKFLATGKCKVLNKTHLNKRDGGFSRNLTTCKKVYTTQDVTMKNLRKKRCIIFSEAIAKDKYFTFILGEKEAKALSNSLYLALEYYYGVGRFSFKSFIIKFYQSLKLIFNIGRYR